MIASILRLDRPLVVLDCETTGLNPQQDRIIELAFEVHRPDGKIDEWRSLIDPGVMIPAHVTKVHGITDEMMKGCRVCGGNPHGSPIVPDAPNGMICMCAEFKPVPKFVQIAQKLARGSSGCDFAGKNVRFDLGFLTEEFKRANVAWSYAGAAILDADQLERIAKPRHLSDLYKLYTGQDLVNAHSALADVKATTQVIVAQLMAHETVLPRSLQKLHKMSWPDRLDSEGKFKMRDGVPIVAFGKRYNGVPMDKVPADFYRDFILKNDFSDEVKQIAREALEGRFPK